MVNMIVLDMEKSDGILVAKKPSLGLYVPWSWSQRALWCVKWPKFFPLRINNLIWMELHAGPTSRHLTSTKIKKSFAAPDKSFPDKDAQNLNALTQDLSRHSENLRDLDWPREFLGSGHSSVEFSNIRLLHSRVSALWDKLSASEPPSTTVTTFWVETKPLPLDSAAALRHTETMRVVGFSFGHLPVRQY